MKIKVTNINDSEIIINTEIRLSQEEHSTIMLEYGNLEVFLAERMSTDIPNDEALRRLKNLDLKAEFKGFQ